MRRISRSQAPAAPLPWPQVDEHERNLTDLQSYAFVKTNARTKTRKGVAPSTNTHALTFKSLQLLTEQPPKGKAATSP